MVLISSNTDTTFEVQFKKDLSNTKADLEKGVRINCSSLAMMINTMNILFQMVFESNLSTLECHELNL